MMQGVYFGRGVARRTVRAFSDIALGADPIKVADQVMKDWPGPVGEQIAEDACRFYLRHPEFSR